ncbi:MAG TPA: hypothetical protein VHT53_11880 [Candidatus Elarobacter sp.]|nr:hypothetical protein [Candidatus Elarobacter sp.]
MPRADPTRSAYCASRHLLRNLDDAAELRRNPLVRTLFAPCNDDAPDRAGALDRVRALVHASLAGCRGRAGARTHGSLGRMHAALLRCEIDKQPLAVVAAELGLSDRQIRRERRAAHDAFLRALAERTAAPAAAVVRDRAELRLARASEMHELGESALALAACDEFLACAPEEHRVEALCLAAEIERECGRYAASKNRVDRASAALAQMTACAPPGTVSLARERVDFSAWSLRRALGEGCALALSPPAVTAHADAEDPRDEPRLALLVRALGAYGEQRWEVGDGIVGDRVVQRAWRLVGSLDAARTKERLSVMLADARMADLTGRDDHAAFLAAERLAARRGHLRARIIARAERIGTEMIAYGRGPLMETVLGEYEGAHLKLMPGAVAAAAFAGMHVEADERLRDGLCDLVLRMLPPRSALALLARSVYVFQQLVEGRYEQARIAAHAVQNDAAAAGNLRVRGGAERVLAHVALMQLRRRDARRHVHDALGALDRYGAWYSRRDARALARRLDVAKPRMFLSANIPLKAAG